MDAGVILDDSIESTETGKWTFTSLAKAILIALKYLIENV